MTDSNIVLLCADALAVPIFRSLPRPWLHRTPTYPYRVHTHQCSIVVGPHSLCSYMICGRSSGNDV